MITKKQFSTLESYFVYYNKELFDGKLNDCMINMSRKKNCYGFFKGEGWINGKKNIHEISLNPDGLERPDIEWQATLAHEMAHLWQADFGKPSRITYHNKEWADKMEEIGLIPSSTGKEGGKKTGQSMTHYIDPNGKYIKAFNAVKEKILILKPAPDFKIAKLKRAGCSKIKYSCPCGNNVWGKTGLIIICSACNKIFEEKGGRDAG
jgi:predicted SprT family Zn-dependent metalloprotease